MGIGHPIDILVCIALGCDQFDCVWPTRIARMGVALVRDQRREVNVKREIKGTAEEVCRIKNSRLDPTCGCPTCRDYTFGYLHVLLKNQEPSVCNLLTVHNLWHHKKFLSDIRESIEGRRFPEFVNEYLNQVNYFPDWALEALEKVGIKVHQVQKVQSQIQSDASTKN